MTDTTNPTLPSNPPGPVERHPWPFKVQEPVKPQPTQPEAPEGSAEGDPA